MSEPLVCAVMLTKDRPQMAARAVRAFREQTYPNKQLLIYDTGADPDLELPQEILDMEDEGVQLLESNCVNHHGQQKTIGYLRNRAISAKREAEIIITWDDDDWSHPNRIAEQVAHLQASEADVVGYSELLFWREMRMCNYCAVARVSPDEFCQTCGKDLMEPCGEAWLFKNARRPPGTSLCYWRKTWERKPFPDLNVSEDTHWLIGLNVASVPTFVTLSGRQRQMEDEPGDDEECEPRIIASIHGNNTADYDIEGMIARGSRNWNRVPEWDSYCQEKMKL